jgi:hypothetical protein
MEKISESPLSYPELFALAVEWRDELPHLARAEEAQLCEIIDRRTSEESIETGYVVHGLEAGKISFAINGGSVQIPLQQQDLEDGKLEVTLL